VKAPFDLSRFAPNPLFEFKLHGRTYSCTSDPDVDQVARMLRIEQTLQDGGEEMAASMVEGKQLLLDLIRDANPEADLENFRIGARQLLGIFAAITHGESVAQAVLEAISNLEAEQAAAEAPEPAGETGDDPDGFTAREGAAVTPLPSPRRSPEPSSSSDEPDASRQAIGTG
jgi:hypothetical protein